jgi:hypothetical protein
VYNFSLIKQGINPNAVKLSFTENIALEKVPEEFLPLYKKFLTLTDELQLNFELIQKDESALVEQAKTAQKQQLVSLAKTGAMALDLIGAGGAASSSLTFLSTFISKGSNGSFVSPESIKEYRRQNKGILTDFEFSLRLARKYSPNTDTLTLKDAEQFVAIEKEYKLDNYSKLLELDARVKGFYPIKYNLGKLELFQKKFEKSYNSFLASIQQLSEVTYNSEIKIDILEQLIITSIKLNKGKDTITNYSDKLAVISPNNPYVHLISGMKYLEQKNRDKALEIFSVANNESKGKPFISHMIFTIQCKLEAWDDCYKSLLNIKETTPNSLNELRENEAVIALKEKSPNLYTDLFGLSFTWAMDWHLINYDRIILTNTSAFKWTTIVAGSTYKESHDAKVFRPFKDYWYSYGDLEAGKTIAINLTKSTKNALEYVDIHLKTDQGNINFRLQNLGNGKMRYSPLDNTGT